MRRPSGVSPAVSFRVAIVTLVLLLVTLGNAAGSVRAQNNDPADHLQDLINQVRLNEGLAPLGHSTLLAQAAQRHADDLVSLGMVTHGGSDGSTYQQRITESRYHAWNDGLIVNEVIWAGLGSAEDALTWFYTHPDWAVLADLTYREIGVGYADDNGIRYFVVTLGSRPGVLPVFVNEGLGITDSPVVALRLTNEDAVPFGDGTWIGRAIEIRIGNTAELAGEQWQPWEPLVPWALPSDAPGDYAVYVEFRDGAERTAIAEATIRLVAAGESPPTPTPFLGLPSAPGEQTPSPDKPAVEPTAPVTTATPVADGTQEATPEPVGGTFTPYPTWTPLPTDTPNVAEKQPTDWPLILGIGLQGVALLLGVAVFLKRR